MTINGVALLEKLEPVIEIGLFFIICFAVSMTIKMIISIIESEKSRKRLHELKQLYTARKRKFEGNELGWKKWRDDNYKITDLVEADSYYY